VKTIRLADSAIVSNCNLTRIRALAIVVLERHLKVPKP